MQFIPPIKNKTEFPHAMLEISQNSAIWTHIGLLTNVKIIEIKKSIDISCDNGKLFKNSLFTTIEGKFNVYDEENLNNIKNGTSYVARLTYKNPEGVSVVNTIPDIKFNGDFIHNLPNIKLESIIESIN
jgi:hypothetical protein